MTQDIRQLLSKDKVLFKIIDTPIDYSKHLHPSLLEALCSSIVSQQVSVAAARTIFGRFLDLFSEHTVFAQELTQMDHATLRSCGLSNQKSKYVGNVAEFFIEHQISDETLFSMPDDEIISLLTQIKGVGVWTVRMILIFYMGREDVFPVGDLAVRKKMIELYDLHGTKKELTNQMDTIAAAWQPYRSIASRLLWCHYANEGNG